MAKPLGDGTYRILNSPFFFYGVSFEDTVRAAPASDGMLEFREVVERSGSSTYRIMAREGVEQEQFDSFWQPLSELGCTLERAKGRFYALDVPPGADLDQTTALFANGETAGVWDWEEAHRHGQAKAFDSPTATPRRPWMTAARESTSMSLMRVLQGLALASLLPACGGGGGASSFGGVTQPEITTVPAGSETSAAGSSTSGSSPG